MAKPKTRKEELEADILKLQGERDKSSDTFKIIRLGSKIKKLKKELDAIIE